MGPAKVTRPGEKQAHSEAPPGLPDRSIDTKLIHAGEPRPRIEGAVSMPIFQSATFGYDGGGDSGPIRYIRYNNTPNHDVLHAKLADLENAEAALVTASGMGATAAALLTLLSPGDHLLAQSCLYGGTHDLIIRDLAGLGITCDFVPGDDPEAWERSLKPRTRLLLVESLSNPLLELADLKAAAEFCRARDLVSVIDNTFATPVNFRPAEWGFDLSLHSGTKYLNGHSDIVAGAVIGRRDLVDRISARLTRLGATLDPHACFLLHRGLKTLALRVRHQNRSAKAVAEHLEKRPEIERVNYPGLRSHPGHVLAGELFDGYGGMLSFEMRGGVAAAERLIENLRLPIRAPSLGGVESLITRPSTTSHAGMSMDDRLALGISDSLVRLSVGIESTEDLLADFDRALSA